MIDLRSASGFRAPGSLAAAPTVPGWAYTTCGCVGPRDHLHVSEPSDFKERTIGIGPQIGFVIPISEGYQGYLNPSGYRDPAVEKAPQSRHDLVVQVD